MTLIPLELPPGVYRNGTPLQAKPRWYDSNLVRWREGALVPQGGWARRKDDSDLDLKVDGAARASFMWRANNGVAWFAVGTHKKLYIHQSGISQDDITPVGLIAGAVDASLADGYGMGDYNGDSNTDYGMPAVLDEATALITGATTWALDNFGQNLIALSTADKRLWMWDPATPSSPAAAITPSAGTVPQGVWALVTNERIAMVFGADGDPRKIKWSDQEDITDWAATPLNYAGDIQLQTNGEIITARKIPDGIIVFTTEDVHIGRFIGLPYVYGFTPLAGKTSIASAQAVANIDSRVVWAGQAAYWMYDGYLNPLPSDLADDMMGHLNHNQVSKVWALTNHGQQEVVWFYPSENSQEIDRYVTWNWRDNYWIRGRCVRTTGYSAGIIPTPILIGAPDDTGFSYIYNHNQGFQYDGDRPYVESWPMEIGEGDVMMIARRLIPDEAQLGDVEVEFKTRLYPTGPETVHGPYSLKNPTNLRLSGRQMAIRFTGARPVDWRIGKMRLEVIPGGRRPFSA